MAITFSVSPLGLLANIGSYVKGFAVYVLWLIGREVGGGGWGMSRWGWGWVKMENMPNMAQFNGLGHQLMKLDVQQEHAQAHKDTITQSQIPRRRNSTYKPHLSINLTGMVLGGTMQTRKKTKSPY
jgi:hypothetical protein